MTEQKHEWQLLELQVKQQKLKAQVEGWQLEAEEQCWQAEHQWVREHEQHELRMLQIHFQYSQPNTNASGSTLLPFGLSTDFHLPDKVYLT